MAVAPQNPDIRQEAAEEVQQHHTSGSDVKPPSSDSLGHLDCRSGLTTAATQCGTGHLHVPKSGDLTEESSSTTTQDVPVPAMEALQENEGVEDEGSS